MNEERLHRSLSDPTPAFFRMGGWTRPCWTNTERARNTTKSIFLKGFKHDKLPPKSGFGE